MIIPRPGEVYRYHATEMQVLSVSMGKDFKVEKVTLLCSGQTATFGAAAWAQLEPALVLVKPAPPPPAPLAIRLDFVPHVMPDIKLMQAFEKSFAMGTGDVEAGYIGRELVTVLVARGPMAEALRDLGLKIHKYVHENKAKDSKSQN